MLKHISLEFLQDFYDYLCKNAQTHYLWGNENGEKLMSTDLKYSLVTTVIVLSLIVFGGLTAALH